MSEHEKLGYLSNPFAIGGGEFIENGRVRKIVGNAVVEARFKNGDIALVGRDKTGKSSVLARIVDNLSNGGFAMIAFEANKNTDVGREIAAALGFSLRSSRPEIMRNLASEYASGNNILFIIDDLMALPQTEYNLINEIKEKFAKTNVIFTVSKKKHINWLKKTGLNLNMIKISTVKRKGIFRATAFLRAISWSNLTLTRRRNPLGLVGAFTIAFCANRNMEELLRLADDAMERSSREGKKKITLKNILLAAKGRFKYVRLNIYAKIQKAFLIFIALITVVFVVKMFMDRDLIIKENLARPGIQALEERIGSN
ncbi:MAG: hypothetical protein FWD15_00740 [Alphaproteobacteria bacterium]|nr:hypothetical protein [Alphaproteobacteria bacterium]